MQYSQIIDISYPLTQSLIVYPGNPRIGIEEMKSATGSSIISKITFGSHTGTHIDAPKHINQEGNSIDMFDLSVFIGPCRVIDCTEESTSVSPDVMQRNSIQKDERILLKTKNSLRGFASFYDDYTFISPEAAAYLADRVTLIGIDYLSVKQRGSQDNRPHSEFLSKNIPIIEGVDLSHVSPGSYQLIALPLKFVGLDGAPARVILLK